jgi:hypothetical protein
VDLTDDSISDLCLLGEEVLPIIPTIGHNFLDHGKDSEMLFVRHSKCNGSDGSSDVYDPNRRTEVD